MAGRSTTRAFGLALLLALIATFFVTTPASAAGHQPASRATTSVAEERAAISASSFNPGLIISDGLFFDSNAMTLAQIQAFLDAKVSTCANAYCLANYRTTSKSKPADSFCSAYTGSSSESAASIIYRVQRACGVSARAILVTLQKEQGLITKTAPTSGAVRIAMGYGCPDTAACDSTYYGFFNQVYQAARQFQRYSDPSTSFHWYPIGQVSNVRYHPNAACGSKAVRIQNRATAALYYYTPYTPNAAALANLGGTGNSCSSYGNRNFWYHFYSWFGDPLAGAGDAAIATAYADASGILGDAVAPLAACGTKKSCSQRYANGGIYWMASTGAVVLTGAVWEEFAYQNYGSGTLGYPTGPAVNTAGGGGTPFQTGTIYSSAAGTFAVIKPLRDSYWANGSNAGALGWPTARFECSGTICSQEFQGGVLFASGATGRIMGLDYLPAFDAAGGLAVLGMPAAARVQMPSTPNGPGSGQSFTKGVILSSANGTYGVAGSIKTAYGTVGSYVGSFGWPTGHLACASGSCRQSFQGGAVITSTSGTFAVASDYLAIMDASSGLSSLGKPAGPRVAIKNTNATGAGQTFQNGSIYSSPAGAFAVIEPMRAVYASRGGNAGALGFPIATQTCAGTTCTQRFQHGTLTSASLDNSDVTRYWVESGGARGPLGAATSGIVTIPASGSTPAGIGQAFSKGTVYSSPHGTWAVYLPLRNEYAAHLSYRGPLGWPTADQVCVSGECTQTFQGGMVFASTLRGGRVLESAYLSVYDEGRSGLGVPLSDAIALPTAANGNGRGQSFLYGTIYQGPAGPFAVLRPIRDAYAKAGSYAGRLGWPTSAKTCVGSDCIQSFQHGLVTATASGSTWTIEGAMATAYQAGGGLAGMGAATGDRVTVPASANGGGFSQSFQKGAIYSSAAGSFIVSSTLLTEYLRLGGPAGSLGWPNAAASCASGECSQSFTNGILYHSTARGARTILGTYRTAFVAVGGAAVIGVPTGAPIIVTGNPNGNGEGQPFENGTIYKSAAGTFAVVKPMRDLYWAQGSNAGSLGWPIGPETCSGGVCTQPFQGGVLTR